MNECKCQMQCTDTMQESRPQPVPISIRRRLWKTPGRRMDPHLKSCIKEYLNLFTRWQAAGTHSIGITPQVDIKPAVALLNSGDMVRIRLLKEIRAIL
jgi:hypothetical protein